MKKILIELKKNSLIFEYNYKYQEHKEDLINTNIISDNKLIFSDEYIIKNYNLVGLFIKELIQNNNIDKIIITNLEILVTFKDALEYIPNLDLLYISDENNFTYEAYEIIIKLNKFKNISCYSIPTYMIELFDKNNVNIESRQEILYTSNFFEDNNLISYSKMYYKTSIKFTPPLIDKDYLDFESFLKINKYLKTIHFNSCSIESLNTLSKILVKHKIKHLRIIIHDNITDKDIINKLKRIKRYLKRHGNLLDLKYTNEYVKNNLGKQIIYTTLLLCAALTILISAGSCVFIVLSNMQSEQNIEDIKSRIEETISNVNEEEIKKEDEPIEVEPVEEDDPKKERPAVPLEEYMLPKMRALLDLNTDTVGWIIVPGTNIDYPVVKANDNSYYLSHNYDKKWDYNGWVFMNSANSTRDLDRNTILFAHNRFYSGVMFGTLSNLTKENWYNNAKNIRIYFNTMFEEHEWEVFSIYSIKVTDDYLQSDFDSDEEYMIFIETLRARSIFQSDTIIDENDKILTLSTCVENDARLVVHAVLR